MLRCSAKESSGIKYDIELNSCGCFKDVDTKVIVSRPNGRSDYHLIIVEHGMVETEIDGKIEFAGSGSIICYPPGYEQKYCYLSYINSLYYWLHFDGIRAKEMADAYGIGHGIYRIGQNSEVDAVIDSIMHILRAEDGYSFSINSMTQYVLAKLYRMANKAENSAKGTTRISRVAAEIWGNPEHRLSGAELAQKCNLSEYHFIRVFKAETGYTPHEYRNLAIIEKAKHLLADTEMNINEIAYLLGVNDPLYFSRMFKNKVGMSPSVYRKSRLL